jgi:hypothetical protein
MMMHLKTELYMSTPHRPPLPHPLLRLLIQSIRKILILRAKAFTFAGLFEKSMPKRLKICAAR